MPTPIQQSNLNGGEISPTLYGRVDLERYHQALALCENFIVDPHGGVFNRQGTEYFADCKLQNGSTVRLITFQPSADESYLIELGHKYLRIFDEHGPLFTPANAELAFWDNTPHTYQQALSQLSAPLIWQVAESFVGSAVNPFSIGKIAFKIRRGTFGSFQVPASVAIYSNGAGNKPGTVQTGLDFTDFTTTTDWTDGGGAIPVYPADPDWVIFELKNPAAGHAAFAPGTILHVVLKCQVIPGASIYEVALTGPGDPTYSGVCNNFTSAGGWVNQPSTNDYKFRVFNNDPATLVEIVTPWSAVSQDDIGTESQISRLVYTQSVDVMTIVDGLKIEPAYELKRNFGGFWTLTTLTKFVDRGQPFSVSVNVGNVVAPLRAWQYAVSGVTVDNFEGLPKLSAEVNIGAAISTVVPAILTVVVGSDIVDHYNVYKGLDGTFGYIGSIKVPRTAAERAKAAYDIAYSNYLAAYNASHGGISNADATAVYAAARAAGQAASDAAALANGVTPTPPGPATSLRFHDENYGPDFTDHPRDGSNRFTPEGGLKPACVCYFQQRLVFANVLGQPDTVFMSEVSDYQSFQRSIPTVADDAIEATLAQGQLNEIRFLVPKRDLLVLTTGAEHVMSGGGHAVGPDNIDAAPVSYRGCGTLHPLNVGNVVLFKDIGGHIREWLYEQNSNDYPAADIGQLASHLFRDETSGTPVKITEWGYISSPISIVAAVRADGMMLGFTYMRDQSVAAWTRHTTQGKFRSAAVARHISSEGETLYVVAERLVGGVSKWLIERISPRNEVTSPYSDSAIVTLLDSQQKNGHPASGPDWIFQLGTGSGWSVDTLSQLVAGATAEIKIPTFTLPGSLLAVPVYPNFAGNEKRWIVLYDEFGKRYTMQIIKVWPGVGNENIYQVLLDAAIPAPLAQAVRADGDLDFDAPKPYWHYGAKRFTGLTHLIGEEVAIRADGGSHPPLTVESDGSITLSLIANQMAAGLAFESTIRTLSLSAPSQGDIKTKQKLISSVGLDVLNVKGLWVGETLDGMTQQRAAFPDPTVGETGRIEIRCANRWGRNGQVYAQNRDPVPCTILAISPEVSFGG